MEIETGAIPSIRHKLCELLDGEYNLQKEVRGGIILLLSELGSMQLDLENISSKPADKIDDRDKIWARKVREMSYNIEDNIDKYIVQGKGRKTAEQHSFKEAIDRTLKWFGQTKIRRKIATEIREIKSRVIELNEQRHRYWDSLGVDKPTLLEDPRLFFVYTENKELVGIDEAMDELFSKIMIEENEVPKKQGKIVSIVGFAGLGKTALALAVYEKIGARFDCYAFVSVSQTPDLKRLYRNLLLNLRENINDDETLDAEQLIRVLREFLEDKRYFVVVDDVWDISVWEMIRCALPDNDVGYAIITTTRISHVAEQVGGAYNMKPLSLNNSRKLLYRRIFGNGNKDNNEDIVKCPDYELAEVSDRILKKCAGVPLAIVTIASLLACKARNKIEWYGVYNSISTGLENRRVVDLMRKVLSLSYYELPCHLRACLLYLSMFPEDYEIEMDHLIWMWIGEGFIKCEEAGKSLFELGESYFNMLININMIQPIHSSNNAVPSCRVHYMVLDLIRSLSSEQNFVTVLSNMRGTSLSNTMGRLSIQNGQESHKMAQATWRLQHVRSVVVFPASVSLMPPLDCCRALRVLDLEDCNLSQANSILKCLGNIHQLRYLGLRQTGISQLPEEIGNLQFLQTLDVRRNKIFRLPSSVAQLRKLMCLRIDMDTRVPNGIASLTSLEELSQICIYDSTDIEIIYCLTELRVLDISWHIDCMDSLEKPLLECLCKLQKIQNLNIIVTSGECKLDSLVDLSHKLRRLCLRGCWFSNLPAWVNPSVLGDLSFISISVIELKEEDFEILGRLPLCYLNLKVDHENLGIIRRFIIGAFFFPCLVGCVLWGFRGPVVFHQGAMPRLRSLRFTLHARDTREISGSSDGGYDFGFQNLPSLQDVTVLFRCGCTSDEEVKEVKAALRHATTIHPNHPTIDIVGYEDKDE